MDALKLLLNVLIFIAPSYVANGTPVVASKVLTKLLGRLHPIDGGRYFIDGRRVLGDGKTVEGFISGVVVGTAAGLVLSALSLHEPAKSFILALGAMLGDLAGSFVKRRLGIGRGRPAPVLDQLAFLAASLALYSAFWPPPSVREIAALVLLTIILHPATNALAYLLGLKDNPW